MTGFLLFSLFIIQIVQKMVSTEEILRRIEKGGTLDELAAEFGMRKSVLVARIEFMVRAGYLCEIKSGEGRGCEGCPKSKTCSVPGGGRGWVRMYMLTEKGREYIEGVRRDKRFNN